MGLVDVVVRRDVVLAVVGREAEAERVRLAGRRAEGLASQARGGAPADRGEVLRVIVDDTDLLGDVADDAGRVGVAAVVLEGVALGVRQVERRPDTLEQVALVLVVPGAERDVQAVVPEAGLRDRTDIFDLLGQVVVEPVERQRLIDDVVLVIDGGKVDRGVRVVPVLAGPDHVFGPVVAVEGIRIILVTSVVLAGGQEVELIAA